MKNLSATEKFRPVALPSQAGFTVFISIGMRLNMNRSFLPQHSLFITYSHRLIFNV